MIHGAGLRAQLELRQRIGDAEVVEQVLGEVQVGEVVGEGRIGLARRDQAALIDGIEPLAEVDQRGGAALGAGTADVLGLRVEHGAKDLRLEGLLGHACGEGGDDAAGGCLLRLDDGLVVLGCGGLDHQPAGEIQLVGVAGGGIAGAAR